MSKILILIGLIWGTTTLFGAYDVKIGVYKNVKNLRINIAKVQGEKYKKSIKIDKKGTLYYAHAVMPTSKEARNALRSYKRVFNDAFIAKKQIKYYPSKHTSKIVSHPMAKQKNSIDVQSLLSNQTVYLCYDKSPKHLSRRVVKMVFLKENIEYSPLEKDTTFNIKYTFNDDKVILNLLDMNVTHKIDSEKQGYLVATNSIKDVIVYTLRYYFNREDALAFVESKKVN